MKRNLVKGIRLDGYQDYMGLKFHNSLKKRSIVDETTIEYLSESNGLPEMLKQSLEGTARALLLETPKGKPKMWANAVNTACFIHPRL